MPKTTKRQAFVWSTSSSDSDVDDVSLPYARNVQSPRRRQYGKRKPVKNSSRRHRSSSKVSSSAPSKQQRRTESTTTRISASNAEFSARTHKAMKTSTSHSHTSFKKDHSSSRAPPASRNPRRPSSEQSTAPSFPAYTPIASKKKSSATRTRAPIRVNLTPDARDDMPKGWLSKSQLLSVARRHKGMAIQYRVMYHASQKPIKDYNAGATRKIRYRDVVVQSRFACASGSHGGSTFSFIRWKLPGTLLQARNAKHVTIYKDTRPQLEAKQETDHPLIVLCGELKEVDRRMAERFLRQAQAGMTPQEFYSRDESKTGTNSAPKDVSDSMQVEQDDSSLVLQDEDAGETLAGGYESEMENEAPVEKLSTANHSGSSRRESQSPSRTKARPLRDHRNASPKSSSSSSKRSRDSGSEGTTSKRAKKKVYGGARKQSQLVTFQIGDYNESSSPQFLALVEGVVGINSGSGDPDDKAQDYIRDVFMNGRAEKLPSTGRMLELPGEALQGTWSAQLVDTMHGGTTTPGKGMMRDKIENLKSLRILLRHESIKSMGPLRLSQSSSVSSPLSCSSSNMEHRIRGGGTGSPKKRGMDTEATTVSLIDPSHSRRHDFLSQGIVSKESLLERTAFMGSISLAAFDGFSSSTDARLSGSTKSRTLLENCRKRAINTNGDDSLENILPIPADGATTYHEDNIGVSFLCKVEMEDSYGLMVAHDDGCIVAVDVVFDEALFESRSSLSSTSSYQHGPSTLTERALQRHSTLSQETDISPVLQKAVDASSEYSDDNAGMLLLDDDKVEVDSVVQVCPPRASEPEGINTASETIDSYHTKPKSVVTIDPTPSTKRVGHVPSTSTAPKSILKNNKRSSFIREVTPAPQAREAEKQIESLSSSDDDDPIEAPTTGGFFVTPTPSHKKKTNQDTAQNDGFLAMLDRVAERESNRADASNVSEQEDRDEDGSTIFEDAVSEGFEMYDLSNCQSPESSVSPCKVAKLPFHHDAIFAVQQEEAKDHSLTRSDPTTVVETDVDDSTVLPIALKTPARRRCFRALPFSAFRLVSVAILVLWQATLDLNNGGGIQQPTLPQRPTSTFPPDYNSFAAKHHAVGSTMATDVPEDASWLNKLW